ncbi:hypothetical protein [Actinomadura sp. DC4]|uniref:hypothetical protein n=1 Tax=Actinomadura sp. DC4 TaxID=3055069 RepID=UPI0025B01B41|nr:hypothetical protein [Actinomadura sp. DC4]MDN3351263.1 hypothetical protein [Actinomadura sp. DC4]
MDAGDLREMLRFISYDNGYPAALAALDRRTEIEREDGLPGPTGQRHDVDADGAQYGMTKAWRGLRAVDELLAGSYAGRVCN